MYLRSKAAARQNELEVLSGHNYLQDLIGVVLDRSGPVAMIYMTTGWLKFLLPIVILFIG